MSTLFDEYKENGFVLLRQAVDLHALDRLETAVLELVEEYSGRQFKSLLDPDFAACLVADRDLERRIYEDVRSFPWLTEFSSDASLVGPIASLLGQNFGLYEKIPLRLDLPMVMRELAVWHQDYHYVKGNTEVVTAWVPLQDTPYEVGCLLVMPGSHKLGIVEHDVTLLQKKRVPSGIFGREVRYVEMERGDLLLFNALLLHSSGINISERIRMSVQARYTPLNLPSDPAMGRVIDLENVK